jgi:hypothetical protein
VSLQPQNMAFLILIILMAGDNKYRSEVTFSDVMCTTNCQSLSDSSSTRGGGGGSERITSSSLTGASWIWSWAHTEIDALTTRVERDSRPHCSQCQWRDVHTESRAYSSPASKCNSGDGQTSLVIKHEPSFPYRTWLGCRCYGVWSYDLDTKL